MNNTIVERVEKGAKLLDEKCPNWWNKVDISELNQGSSSTCVLGQLKGDYVNGLDFLGMEAGNPAREKGYSYYFYEEVDNLNAEWKKQILQRRNKVKKVTKEQYENAKKLIKQFEAQIEVGDIVQSKINENRYEVLAIVGEKAWVKHEDGKHEYIEPLDKFKKI
jgi:hypothetical protein